MKTCSGCGEAKCWSDFAKRQASLDGLSPLCRPCKALRDQERYQKNRSKILRKIRKRTVLHQRIIGTYKAQLGCCVCGRSGGPDWLYDFDHLRDKERLVSKMLSHSLTNIQNELQKCQVLCTNCHRTTTYFRHHGTLDPVVPKKALKTAVLRRMWEKLLEFKSRSCMDCGNSFHFSAMDCDHRVPGAKCGDLSTLARNGSEPLFLLELEKCDAVCSCCHRIRTNNPLTLAP